MVPPANPSPAPPNPQITQQFLSSVLSQRGPSALPYTEDTKWLIRQHLVSLAAAFPALELKTATFTHNDGRTVNLLQADGTIPISFQGVTYNIPFLIWLIESYPRHPPCVYVNPTRDMIIKRPHPHVNPSGLVSVPYLHSWVYPSSNLLDLAKELSLIFGRDPPLYSRQRPAPRTPPSVSSSSDAAEVFRRNAAAKIAEAALADLAGMRRARETEMEGMFSAQGELRRRGEELRRGLGEMGAEKEALEQRLQMVLMNSDVLEGWLRDNQGRTTTTLNEDGMECADVASRQMMECTAGDVAIEDMVYALDKAVQDAAVPFDQYLRSVRLLSREQFFHRATAAKIRALNKDSHMASHFVS